MNDGAQALVSSLSGSKDGGARSQRRREAVFLGEEAGGRFLKRHKRGEKNSSAEW